MSQVDLYLRLQTNLVRGRIIQHIYFTTWEDKEGNIHQNARITYLCGEIVDVPLQPVLTPDQLDKVLSDVCELQATPCYPSSGKSPCCDLGITKLS